MSEQEITSSLPTGSPILAYGTTDTKSPIRTILAAIAGIFVVTLIGLSVYLRTPIRMPDHIVALAAVRAQTELPDGSPSVWVDILHQTNTPVILGIAKTDTGLVPFAITRTGHGASRFTREDNGPLSFYSDNSIVKSQSWPLSRVLSFASKALSAPAYLRLDTSTLVENGGSVIDGSIGADGVWKTSLRVPTDIASDLPDGDVRLNVRAFPEAWPMVKQELTRSGFPIEGSIAPSAIGWSPTAGVLPNIDLQFQEDVPSSTIASFAAAAGAYDEIPYRLPDGVVTQEFRLPLDQVASATDGRLEVASGTTLLVSPRRLAIQTGAVQDGTVTGCEEGETPILHFDAAILESLSQTLQTVLPKVVGVTLSTKDGSVDVCAK